MKSYLSFICALALSGSINASETVKHFKILTDKPCQTIDGFGASDAWSMQFVGLWDEDVRNQVADWLFSQENDSEGQPKGIGLSIWRFNIGSGSTEQGDKSQIGSIDTRTECFLTSDGSYDWNKQKGQVNIMKMAQERGVKTFIGFFNSPPVYFTENGLATNTGRGGTLNLRKGKEDAWAEFTANVIKGLNKHHGISLDYVCPVNEPDGHWNWIGPKQEGTPATNREIAYVTKAMSKKFVEQGIKTKLLVNESSDYRCLIGIHMTDWSRGNSISAFFCPDSTETYLGNTPLVERRIAAHSYWTNTPLEYLPKIRKEIRDKMKEYNVDFWQTETCIMGNDQEIGGGGGYDRTMKTALYVARIIHHDIVFAEARSWQWWRAIGGNYKDGLLRYFPSPDRTHGKVVDSKLLWSLGNYSRFIRPSAKRISIETIDSNGTIIPDGDTDVNGIMCTAYQNKNGENVFVVINYAEKDETITFERAEKRKKQWQAYVTNDKEGYNLKPAFKIKEGTETTIPARSIITFVCK